MWQGVQHVLKSTCEDDKTFSETAVAASLSKEAEFKKFDTGIILAPPVILISPHKFFH